MGQEVVKDKRSKRQGQEEPQACAGLAKPAESPRAGCPLKESAIVWVSIPKDLCAKGLIASLWHSWEAVESQGGGA
jgi:hypothetical protein